MKGLLLNEWIKIMKQKSTIVMVVLLIIGVFGLAGITVAMNKDEGNVGISPTWEQDLEQTIASDKETVKGLSDSYYKKNLEQSIAVNEYRIENNLPPLQEYNVSSFMDDSIGLVSFVGLFVIIIAASIVASEYSWGTIKLLLIRPANRIQILVAKYITVLAYGFTLLILLFFVSLLTGFVVFGSPSEAIPYLSYAGGEVVEKSWVANMFTQYLLTTVDILLIATMAFAVSTLFRNQSLAIGLSLFLLFVGSTATLILTQYFDWAKYLLFANTDLTVYFNGVPFIESMTLGFSIVILVAHWIFFQAVAFVAFVKRDVAG